MSAKSFWSVSNICEVTKFANIENKFNIKQDGSWVLGRSPDMTIHKVRGKRDHSQHYSCNFRWICIFNKTLLLNVYM